ncbi:hypothetical protein [Desulfosoma sp.]|uniref:hypothetical protein n=1 Tax=Desulfosoma sp. TaxID=2603217 RepID=UPI004049EEBE
MAFRCRLRFILQERRKPRLQADAGPLAIQVHGVIAPCGAPTEKNFSGIPQPLQEQKLQRAFSREGMATVKTCDGLIWRQKQRTPPSLIAPCGAPTASSRKIVVKPFSDGLRWGSLRHSL